VDQSRSDWRAAASGSGGPQFVSESASAPQAATRRSFFTFNSLFLICGFCKETPQPAAGPGRRTAPLRRRPTARLRAFALDQSRPAGPLRASAPQAAPRRSFFTFNSLFFIRARSGRSGPQLRPAKARSVRPLLRPLVPALRKPRPDSPSQAYPLGCSPNRNVSQTTSFNFES